MTETPGTLAAPSDPPTEEHVEDAIAVGLASRLNWLRAGVLGANDGIVSVAALVVGVAAASEGTRPVLIAGIAALLAGAISMAMGEYVSVSSQRDTERALIAKEKWELENLPDEELAELAQMYEEKGLKPETAKQVALELTANDALAAHLEVELLLTQDDVSSPWHAAFASAVAFTVGALLPLLAILLPPHDWRIPTTFAAVIFALIVTGWISATFGASSRRVAIARVVAGGVAALAVTYGIGEILGVKV